jgi:hypothetical protein
MFRFVCSAALLGLSVVAPATAATMLFEIEKTSGLGDFESASFTLPEQPVPDFVAANFFRIQNLQDFQVNGVPSSGGPAGFSSSGFEFFFDSGLAYLILIGPSVFSGTFAQPTFVAGNYSFFADLAIIGQDPELGTATVTITRLDVPVIPQIPEPATWAMLIAGFGLVGAGLRRNRARVLA